MTLISRSRNSAAASPRVLSQPLEVALDRVERDHLHAPLHPAKEGPGLVAGEVVAELVAQDDVDLPPRLIEQACRFRVVGGWLGQAVEHREAAGELDETLPHPVGRQGKIHDAGRDGALRHARVLRPVAIGDLGEGQPAALLDGLQAECAVPVAAREHDACRRLAPVGGERAEEHVDRLALAPAIVRPLQVEPPSLDAEDGVGGQDMHRVRLNRRAVGRDVHRQGGEAGDHLVQPALALGAEVRDDDDAEAGAVRQAAEEPLQRLDPAGGGADADDRKAL